jgi:hypothetical protein
MIEADIKNKNRKRILDNLTASMVVIIQLYDMSMSAAIIQDTMEEYGQDAVNEIMTELVVSSYAEDLTSLAKDVFNNRAMLNMLQPLPTTWMQTRN